VKKLCYAGFGGLLLLIGCNVSDVDFSNLKIKDGEADVAVPFGVASYTMRELLEASSPGLVVNENPTTGEMWVTYNSGPTTFNYDGSFINATGAKDNTTNSNLPATSSQAAPQSIPFTFVFGQSYFQNPPESLDEIYFNAGTVDLDISTNLNAAVGTISSYTVTVDELRDRTTNTPMTFTGTNISNGTPGVHAPVSIANQKIGFFQSAGASQYQITVTGNIALNASQALTGTEQLTVRFQFNGQGNEIIVGKFGKDVFDLGSQTMAIDFFQNFNISGIRFGGAQLRFDCINTFGIPIAIDMSGVYGEDANAVQTFLSGSVINTPRIIQSSPIIPPITGAPQQTLINVTNQNSNLPDILATSPTSFTYNLQGRTNNANTTTTNFVMANSSVTTSLEMYIPMEVSMTDVQYQLDFNIGGEGNDLTEIDSAALRVVTTNELPFGGTFDLFILDAADAILYTAAENRAFDQPFLNFDRTVREPKLSTDDVPLSRTGLDALRDGEKVRIVFTLNTPVSQTSEDIFVKILANAKMDVVLGARFIIKTNL
jgi:hypothetical protein